VSKDDVLNKLENEQIKGTACVEICNKGEEPILFKVKTTNIQNYMVKPNADIIPAGQSLTIRVLTQKPISQTKAIAQDKFMIQVAKVQDGMTAGITNPIEPGKLHNEEMVAIWEKVVPASIV
tara:strand:+ start:132 stop:497 length:366 start_codon:yes stop_codon:yes gene_type:complete